MSVLKTISLFLNTYLGARRRFNHDSPAQIQAYQLAKINTLLQFASQNIPFYRRLAPISPLVSLEEFANFPHTQKQTLMAFLSDCNSAGLQKQEIIDFVTENEIQRNFSRRLKGLAIGMSSGTSGNKGIEIVSAEEENILRAFFFARFPYDFLLGERIRLAFILRVTSPAFRLDFIGHRLFYINPLQPLEQVIEQLNSIRPNILSGPPSYLSILAEAVQQGRLHIQPKMLLCYAEVLDGLTRRNITRSFSGKIMEIYKATEGAIGMPCTHGSLHINEDIMYVETLREDYSPCPPGEACSRLLVTDLIKRTLPIIRFELNDVITLRPEACPCGSHFRVIDQIQGRRDAILIGQTAAGSHEYIMPDFIARGLITLSDDIEEYEVVQSSPVNLNIKLQIKPDSISAELLSSQINNLVADVFARFHCIPPRLTIQYGPLPLNPNSGKRIRISRSF